MEEDKDDADGADVTDGNEEQTVEHSILRAVVGKFGKDNLLRSIPSYKDTRQQST
jgi:hypothetical protein